MWHEGIFVLECLVFASQYWQAQIDQGSLYISVSVVDMYFLKAHPANIYVDD